MPFLCPSLREPASLFYKTPKHTPKCLETTIVSLTLPSQLHRADLADPAPFFRDFERPTFTRQKPATPSQTTCHRTSQTVPQLVNADEVQGAGADSDEVSESCSPLAGLLFSPEAPALALAGQRRCGSRACSVSHMLTVGLRLLQFNGAIGIEYAFQNLKSCLIRSKLTFLLALALQSRNHLLLRRCLDG